MNKSEESDLRKYLPADVPANMERTFLRNLSVATDGTGRLMLFAGDQKLEHFNDDFYGENIAVEDANPRHLFQIATQAHIGVFATQLGLMSRYARIYRDTRFLIKLNSKTNAVPFKQKDPLSRAWFTVEQAVNFANSAGLDVMGVGYTVYPGSEYEVEMLHEAAQIVHQAHARGLMTVLWMYPKGKAISDEHDPHLIAGAAGVGACLGADFVKLKVPMMDKVFKPEYMQEIVEAAGNTGVLCEGGSKEKEKEFLTQLHTQIHEGGARGSGTGRNIHQRPLAEAVKMANAIYAVNVLDKSVEEAMQELD